MTCLSVHHLCPLLDHTEVCCWSSVWNFSNQSSGNSVTKPSMLLCILLFAFVVFLHQTFNFVFILFTLKMYLCVVSGSPARLRVLFWTLCHADYESTSLELITGPLFCSPVGVIFLYLWYLKLYTCVSNTKTRKLILVFKNTGLRQSGRAVISQPVGPSDVICRWICCKVLRQTVWYMGKQTGRPNAWVHVCTGAVVGSLEPYSL